MSITVAIWAASATVVVATISGAFSFWTLNRQKYLESKTRQRDDQSKIYSGLIVTLQDLMNSQNPNIHFPAFQKGCVEIFLRGDEKTARKVVEYFNALVNSTNGGEPLDSNSHESFQGDIINCMRAAQGLKKIKDARLVRFNSIN